MAPSSNAKIPGFIPGDVGSKPPGVTIKITRGKRINGLDHPMRILVRGWCNGNTSLPPNLTTMGRYPSGQRMWVVTPRHNCFRGSNPLLPTNKKERNMAKKRKSPSKRVGELSRIRAGFSGVPGVNSNFKKKAVPKKAVPKKASPKKASPKSKGALSNFGRDYKKGLKSIGKWFR